MRFSLSWDERDHYNDEYVAAFATRSHLVANNSSIGIFCSFIIGVMRHIGGRSLFYVTSFWTELHGENYAVHEYCCHTCSWWIASQVTHWRRVTVTNRRWCFRRIWITDGMKSIGRKSARKKDEEAAIFRNRRCRNAVPESFRFWRAHSFRWTQNEHFIPLILVRLCVYVGQ